MDDETRRTLLSLSADFYSAHIESFDGSRKNAWGSWPDLVDLARQRTTVLSVLDIGCGNGRFAGFLESQGIEVDYVGYDTEPAFIEIARERYPTKIFVNGPIEDALTNEGSFDLVVCFGVFHHLPSAAYRQAVIQAFKDSLNPDGVAIISFWQPKTLKNFETKIVRVEDREELESNDFLMGWNGDFTTLRFVHHFERDEIEGLITQSNLDLVALLQGSGNDASNTYVLLANR